MPGGTDCHSAARAGDAEAVEGTPSHKVGSHRRVQTEDLLAYKRDFLAKRHAALDELTALSQELEMGY